MSTPPTQPTFLSQLGSPVTPPLRSPPKDAALHLLCLAAENTLSPHSNPPPPPPHRPNPPALPVYLPPPAHFVPPQPILAYSALPYPNPPLPIPLAPQHLLPFPFEPPLSHSAPPHPAAPTYSYPSAHTPHPHAPHATTTHLPHRKVKGPWRPEEDKILTDLVSRMGPRRWSVIASHIPGRTGKQARERWLNQLSPDLAKRAWTPEEDRIVMEAHARLGNRWSEIAKLLKGRTDNATKNRFNTTIRRQISELASQARGGEGKGVKRKIDAVDRDAGRRRKVQCVEAV